jgi:hypothetical protein
LKEVMPAFLSLDVKVRRGCKREVPLSLPVITQAAVALASPKNGLAGRFAGVRQAPCGLLRTVEGIQIKEPAMIRKLASGEYRLYSRKLDPKTGKRRNLGTFSSMEAAKQHEREVQYFKRH